MYVILAVVWLMFCFFAAAFARRYNRSQVGWFLFALLFSPVLATLALAMLGEVKSSDLTPDQVAKVSALSQADRKIVLVLLGAMAMMAAVFAILVLF